LLSTAQMSALCHKQTHEMHSNLLNGFLDPPKQPVPSQSRREPG